MWSDDEDDLDLPSLGEDWEDVLKPNRTYTVTLMVDFKGSEIRNDAQLLRKLEMFKPEVKFKDVKVIWRRGIAKYLVALDTHYFLELINHEEYGEFPNNHEVVVKSYKYNNSEDGKIDDDQDSPLKKMVSNAANNDDEFRMVVTMRRGPNPSDAPVRGMKTFRILSDKKEITNICKHFKIPKEEVRAVARATPSVPTLEIELNTKVVDILDELELEPIKVYEPTNDLYNEPELWAHLRVNKKEAFKWITIEGIGQRASMDEVCHKLSYMGRILERPVENTWKIGDGEDDYLKDIKNGDISVKMKLDFEVNYLITGMTAYMVNYQGQAKQCGFCFSWKHSRVSECPKRNQGAGREELLRSYYECWKKEVGYVKRPDLDVTAKEPRKNIGEKEKEEKEDETGSEKDILEYEEEEEDDVVKVGGDDENDGEVEVVLVEAGPEEKEKEERGEDDREEEREEAEETKDKQKDVEAGKVEKKKEEAAESEPKENDGEGKTPTAKPGLRSTSSLPKATLKANATKTKMSLELENLEKKQNVKERRLSFSQRPGPAAEKKANNEEDKDGDKIEANNKRKADSPMSNDQKITGSGRKKHAKEVVEELARQTKETDANMKKLNKMKNEREKKIGRSDSMNKKKTEKADETAKNMDKDDKGTKQDNDDKAQK